MERSLDNVHWISQYSQLVVSQETMCRYLTSASHACMQRFVRRMARGQSKMQIASTVSSTKGIVLNGSRSATETVSTLLQQWCSTTKQRLEKMYSSRSRYNFRPTLASGWEYT